MNDHIPAAKVREILDEWERTKEYADWEDMDNLVQDVRALLPTPPLPTLADMTGEERHACRWMQADVADHNTRYVITNPCDEDDEAELIAADGKIEWILPEYVTPRPDLPRLEWPGTEKPAPSLPDGWRLADHKEYGRVIVTRPEPDRDGEFVITRPHPHRMTRTDTDWCDPDELTFLDTGKEADQ